MSLLTAPLLDNLNGERLAVAPIANESSTDANTDITDLVEAEAAKLSGLTVVSHALRNQQVGLQGTVCRVPVIEAVRSTTCLIKLAQAASVRFVVAGEVRTDDSTTHVALQLFDARLCQFLSEQQLSTSGIVHVEDLSSVVALLTRRLLAVPSPMSRGVAQVTGPSASQATIDDRPALAMPFEVSLAEGTHRLQLEPPLETAGSGTFEVLAGERLSYTLSALDQVHPAEVHQDSKFPWGGLVGIGLGAALIAASVVGASQINLNVSNQTAPDYEAVLASAGIFAGSTLLFFSIRSMVNQGSKP